MGVITKGWWNDFFPTFRPIFGIKPPKVTNAEVKYFIKKFNLKKGSKFLDCPCGIGRISIPMAKKGIHVHGVDIIQQYLDEVQKKNDKLRLPITLEQNDMRKINIKNKFDAAANLWTSFGFFKKESDNLLCLKKMYVALKPGGKFLLHVINRDWIVKNFEYSDWFEIGDSKVLQSRTLDLATSANLDTWHFIKDGVEKVHESYIRMYSYHELIAMFKKVGFIDIEGYGNLKEEPITLQHRMMFIFGTKPK